jgi:hypothetical protein
MSCTRPHYRVLPFYLQSKAHPTHPLWDLGLVTPEEAPLSLQHQNFLHSCKDVLKLTTFKNSLREVGCFCFMVSCAARTNLNNKKTSKKVNSEKMKNYDECELSKRHADIHVCSLDSCYF